MKANLCKCLKCDTILIDQNPQTGQELLDVPEDAEEMFFYEGEDENGEYDRFWCCPNCLTDGNLIDLPIDALL